MEEVLKGSMSEKSSRVAVERALQNTYALQCEKNGVLEDGALDAGDPPGGNSSKNDSWLYELTEGQLEEVIEVIIPILLFLPSFISPG